jgi:ribonuclease I
MERMLPDSKGVYNVSKVKFKKILQRKLNINESNYALICQNKENDPENKKYLSEIRFTYDLHFKRTILGKSRENCPDIFLLNFTDETKIPVYQKYDFYVYSLYYGPTSCNGKKKECFDVIKSKEINKFIIHGLWPSYKSGNIPQDCNIGEDIEIKQNDSEYHNYIQKYWYSGYNSNTYLWTHEYNAHGLCYIKYLNESDNNYEIYFNKTIEIFEKYNFVELFDYIYKDFLPREQIVNKTYLLSKLGEKYKKNSFFLRCVKNYGKQYLDEIKFKLDMNFEFTSEGNYKDECQEQFYIQITDPPRKKYDTNEDIWKSYDIYMISIFWQSTTCKEVGYHCYNAIANFPKNIWTLHGLWPNFKNGTIPGWCHGENDIEIRIKDKTLFNFMKSYWPGLYSSNNGFWAHEYNRHGYCYNQRNNIDVNNYDEYFKKAVEIYKKYDLANIFINMFGDEKKEIKINRTEIENYFAQVGIEKNEYLLVCNNNIVVDGKNVSYIEEIRIRFNLDFELYKNETDKSEKDCPFEFMAELL